MLRVLLKKTEISNVSFARGVFVVSGSYGNGLRIEVSKKTPEEWGELYLSGQIYNDQTAGVTLNGGFGTESPQKSPSIPVFLGQLATSEV